MHYSKGILAGALALAALAGAAPAHAQFGWSIGTGLRIPGTGIFTGIGYSRSRWGGGINTGIHVDAGYYLNRRKERRDRDRRERDDDRRGREDDRRENVLLRVSPENTWVYLNGVLIEAMGRDYLDLPPGRHRLEFVREGYRTDVAELEVQSGLRYRIERKLQKLQRGEAGDSRLDRRDTPVTLYEALEKTDYLWKPRTRDDLPVERKRPELP